MELLLFFTTTYLRDLNQVFKEIRCLGSLPTGAKLFTADAILMYTNIHPNHCLEVFEMWFNNFKPEIPDNFQRDLFFYCLCLIMENNVFQIVDTFWHQLHTIRQCVQAQHACTQHYTMPTTKSQSF
jgi:hypothetical protein